MTIKQMIDIAISKGAYPNAFEFVQSYNEQMSRYGTVFFNPETGKILDGKGLIINGHKSKLGCIE